MATSNVTTSGTPTKGPAYTRPQLLTASENEKAGMAWIYASQFYDNQDRAAATNAASVKAYDAAFAQFKFSKDQGREAGAPPIPNYALIVEGDGSEWSQIGLSTERVCPIKTWEPTARPKLGKWLIGPRMYPHNDLFFSCLPGDNTEPFEEEDAVSADGVMGRFEKRAYIISSPGNRVEGIPGCFIRKTEAVKNAI